MDKMDAINLINPFSEHHALENFNKLTLAQKVGIVALTIIASLVTVFIATAAVFRLMVDHYVKLMHPRNVKEDAPLPNRPLPPPVDKPPISSVSSVETDTPLQVPMYSHVSTVNLAENLTSSTLQLPKDVVYSTTPFTLSEPELSSEVTITESLTADVQKPVPLMPLNFITNLPVLLPETSFSLPLSLPSFDSLPLSVTTLDLTPTMLSDAIYALPSSITTLAISDVSDPLPSLLITPEPLTSSLTAITGTTTADPSSLVPVAPKPQAGILVPAHNLEALLSLPSGLDDVSPIISQIPAILSGILAPTIQVLDPVEISAKKSHELALCNIGQTSKLLKLFGNGKIQGVISAVDCFEVDQTLKLKLPGGDIPVEVKGLCYKAEIDGEHKQFAYFIKAFIQNGADSHPLELAFAAKKDASDAVAIGNLVLQHLEKTSQLSLQNKEDGLLTLEPNSEEAPALFKETIPLPSAALEEIILTPKPKSFIPTLQPSLAIEYKGNLVEKETKGDLQEILKELKKTHIEFTEAQINLEESIKAEQSAIEKAKQEEEAELLKNWTDLNASLSLDDKIKEREALGLKENECNLVPYMFQYINDFMSDEPNPSHAIKDTDTVAFKDGTVVKAAEGEQAKTAYKIFHHILKETYGTVLAGRIFGRYRLNKKDTITLRDLKKAMVGIALNVLDGDLKSLFEHIKTDQPGKLTSYRAGNILFGSNKELYLKIKQKNSFDELDREEVCFLHSAFRTLPFQNTRLSVSDVLDHLQKNSEGEDYLYLHDLKALQLMESWKSLNMQHPLWALGEYTGKSLAYLELKKGLILPLPEVADGKPLSEIPHLYKVEGAIEDKNDAVVPHLLVPANTSLSLLPDNDNKTEHSFLVFRGTVPETKGKASGTSFYRDFKWDGIGRSSYDSREKEIQQMVEDYLAKTPKESVTLHISGHSLGACDTQRALVSLLEKVAAAGEGSPWKKLKKIEVTTFNAPRVNPTVNKRLKDAVRKIKEKAIPLEVSLDHIRFFDKSYEDTIQKFGDILLGADLQGGTGSEVFKNCPWFKRRIIEMHMDDDQGLAAGFIVRHGYRPFNKALCNIPYKMRILSSDIEEERKEMEKLMAGTFHWDKDEMGIGSQIINNILWYSSWALIRQPKKVIQSVGNVVHGAALAATQALNSTPYSELDADRSH